MNRDEILNAVSKEKPTDEFEAQVARRGAGIGAAVGIIICVTMFVLELLIFKKYDFGKPAIIITMGAVSYIYEGIRRKKVGSVIGGVISGIVALVFLILYVGALFI